MGLPNPCGELSLRCNSLEPKLTSARKMLKFLLILSLLKDSVAFASCCGSKHGLPCIEEFFGRSEPQMSDDSIVYAQGQVNSTSLVSYDISETSLLLPHFLH